LPETAFADSLDCNMTKILFALATYIFWAFPSPVFANPEPDMVFQCGQDFQRELTRISNSEFMMSEGFAHSESLISSHAYFLVSNSDMHWSKNKCKMELTAHIMDGPSGRVRGPRSAYKFKFQFVKKNGPTSLTFSEDGKAPVNCKVSPKFMTRLKDCQLPTDIPEAMVCKSQVVDGTQVKTVFRYDAKTGISERQVYKVTTTPAPAEAGKEVTVAAKPLEKEEDLGVRGTKFQWKMKNKVCGLKIQEKEEDQDQWLDFQMKFDRRLAANQNGYFNKMRILLDSEHVADLLDNKKNVQCAVDPQILAQSSRCAPLGSMNSVPLRRPAQTGQTKAFKKSR
jgi:hypothetical protein